MFPLMQIIILVARDGFDIAEVFIILILSLFLKELILVDGAGGDDNCLH